MSELDAGLQEILREDAENIEDFWYVVLLDGDGSSSYWGPYGDGEATRYMMDHYPPIQDDASRSGYTERYVRRVSVEPRLKWMHGNGR